MAQYSSELPLNVVPFLLYLPHLDNLLSCNVLFFRLFRFYMNFSFLIFKKKWCLYTSTLLFCSVSSCRWKLALWWTPKRKRPKLTVQPAPSSDVAGVEVGQHSLSRWNTCQLHMITQSHRLGQFNQGNVVTGRKWSRLNEIGHLHHLFGAIEASIWLDYFLVFTCFPSIKLMSKTTKQSFIVFGIRSAVSILVINS